MSQWHLNSSNFKREIKPLGPRKKIVSMTTPRLHGGFWLGVETPIPSRGLTIAGRVQSAWPEM